MFDPHIHKTNYEHKKHTLPENIGSVLYFECYKKGLRSTKDINGRLTHHYHTPIKMEQDEICSVLTKKTRISAFKHFDPKEITE